jgi:putative membrane protein
LAAGVVFRTSTYEHIGHTVAAIVGIGAVLSGGIIMIVATIDYKKKQKGINEETFRSPTGIIWLVLACLGIIQIFLIILVAVLLLY